MSLRKFNVWENSSVPTENNIVEDLPTSRIHTRSRFTIFDSTRGVPPTPTIPNSESDTPTLSPQGDATNSEFYYSINLLTQLVASPS